MNTPETDANILWLRRLIVVAFGLMLLRFLLPPNGFAATVLLFDYEVGLIRRGVMGSLGNLFWGETVSRAEVFALAAGISLFGLMSLLILIRRMFWSSQASLLLALIFVTSFAFGAIVGSTGYMDLVLVGLAALTLLSDPTRRWGLALRILVAGAGVFIHEIMLPTFAVLLSVELWLARQGRDRIWSFGPVAAASAGLLVLAIWGQPNAAEVNWFADHIAAKAEFSVTSADAADAPVDPAAMAVVGRSLGENLGLMESTRAKPAYRAWLIFDGAPPLALSFWFLWLNLKISAGQPPLDRLAILAAILAPLSLNIIAFDVVRFGALSCLVGFLLLGIQTRSEGKARTRLSGVLSWQMALCVVVLGQFFIVSQLSIGSAHTSALPWVFLMQLKWFG